MNLRDLSPAALAAVFRQGHAESWGTFADIHKHARYLEPRDPSFRKRCRCGCGRVAKWRGMANGLCMAFGCELAMRRWLKTGSRYGSRKQWEQTR